ncbi:MAG: hypothetical protein HYU66_21730 [Armatimonadetes bacterium]|nr:hypothetical protein [Armatimonadota bacterium]
MTWFLLPLLIAAAGADEVPVQNPGFEGGAKGWSLPRTYAVDEAMAHTGKASLRVENTDPGLYLLAGQAVPLVAGRRYEFSVWVKTEGVKGDESGATMCIEWSGAKGWLGGAYPGGPKGTADWTLVKSITAPIPPEATSVSATLYLRKGMTGKAWFDDVRIVEYLPRPLTVTRRLPVYRGRASAGDREAKLVVEAHVAERQRGGIALADLDLALALERAADGLGVRAARTVPAAARTVLETRIGDLPAGQYRARIALLRRGDPAPIAVEPVDFEVVPAGAPEPKVWIDDRGRAIVDGGPFFPLGWYDGRSAPDDLRRMAAAGYNTVMPYGINSEGDMAGTATYLDAAQQAGIRVIYSVKDFYDGIEYRPKRVGEWTDVEAMTRGVVAKYRDHPALLAWYCNDELPSSMYDVLSERYRQVRDGDPDHPCWVVLYQSTELLDYAGTYDVLGTDPYPIPAAPLSTVARYARLTRAAVGDGAFWMVPQAMDWACYRKDPEEKAKSRAPTLAEMRNMTYQCLANGAKGLIYYSYFDLKRDPLGFEPRWADMTVIAGEVNRLAPYVLADDATAELGLGGMAGDTLVAAAWRKGAGRLVVAANADREKAGTIAWNLPAGARTEIVCGEASVAPEGITLAPAQSVAVKVTMP